MTTNVVVLGIETAGSNCGIAVVKNGSVLKKSNIFAGQSHSAIIIPLITGLLKKTKLSLRKIDVIAVDAGPGSFTGLRIGVSIARMLAQGIGARAVGVGSLDALAYEQQQRGDCTTYICVPVINSIRCDVYYKTCILRKGKAAKVSRIKLQDINLACEDIIRSCNASGIKKVVFTGPGVGKYEDIIRNNMKALDVELHPCGYPRAESVAVIGSRYVFTYKNGFGYTALKPVYIQQPVAVERLKKLL
ncbi:MAG: tRNA (adenosine(37)-N6)-threonylcarbamoyltransferase complex dimerization subunit type 1 TsaB [Elusimicrobiota bacterium]